MSKPPLMGLNAILSIAEANHWQNHAHRRISCIRPRQGSEVCTGAIASGRSQEHGVGQSGLLKKSMYGTRDASCN